MGLITAQLVSDTVSASGVRKSSFKIKLPKFMLADIATDSRYSMFVGAEHQNIKYRIETVSNITAVPIAWEDEGKQRPLQPDCDCFSDLWFGVSDSCLAEAHHMANLPIPPANRTIEALLDPFDHATVTVTSSNWKMVLSEGFYSKFSVEASIITKHCKEIWEENKPLPIEEGEMYLPYLDKLASSEVSNIVHDSVIGTDDDLIDYTIMSGLKASVGMIYMPRIFDYENEDIIIRSIEAYNNTISEQEMKRIFRDHLFSIQDGKYVKLSPKYINNFSNRIT